VTAGTYVGNHNDSRSITGIGFEPLVVWVKRAGTRASVWRPASLSGDASLSWSATALGSDRIQALEPDGFEVGTDQDVNTNNQTYYHLALRDGGP
jgi:hypothetical protein